MNAVHGTKFRRDSGIFIFFNSLFGKRVCFRLLLPIPAHSLVTDDCGFTTKQIHSIFTHQQPASQIEQIVFSTSSLAECVLRCQGIFEEGMLGRRRVRTVAQKHLGSSAAIRTIAANKQSPSREDNTNTAKRER